MWNQFKFDDIPRHFASLVRSTPENSSLTLEQGGLNVATTVEIAAERVPRICDCWSSRFEINVGICRHKKS